MLVFAGKLLDDYRAFSDYNLSRETSLHVVDIQKTYVVEKTPDSIVKKSEKNELSWFKTRVIEPSQA